MKQDTAAIFESECGMAKVVIKNGMTLGSLHDFLISLKGLVVEKINEIQKTQEEEKKQNEASNGVENV